VVKLQGITREANMAATVPSVHATEVEWVTICQIDVFEASDAPEIVQALLEQFKDVFEEPTGLSPTHSCDRHIPLLPGAQPFYIGPYRHAPVLKDEIKHQVKELLRLDVIRHS
jgi:hypothetical protein